MFQGGFEDGSFGGFLNTVDFSDCTNTPLSTLIVHGLADGVVPFVPYGQDAIAFWLNSGSCQSQSQASPLNADCREFIGCDGVDVVLCDPPGVGHEVWDPFGPGVLDAFLRRFF